MGIDSDFVIIYRPWITVAYFGLLEHLIRKHLNRNAEHLNTFPQNYHPPCNKNYYTWGRLSLACFFIYLNFQGCTFQEFSA